MIKYDVTKPLKDNQEENKIKLINNKLEGITFLFSGFRNKDLESDIKSRGGIIKSTFTKELDYLIVRDKKKVSNKMKMADKYKIPVITNIQKLL